MSSIVPDTRSSPVFLILIGIQGMRLSIRGSYLVTTSQQGWGKGGPPAIGDACDQGQSKLGHCVNVTWKVL